MDIQKEAEQLWKELIFHNGRPKQYRREPEIDYMARILEKRIELIKSYTEKICGEQRESDMKHAAYGWREFPLITDK